MNFPHLHGGAGIWAEAGETFRIQLLVCILFAAWAGRLQSSGESLDAARLLPLVPGSTWTYDLSGNDGEEQMTRTVADGDGIYHGTTAYPMRDESEGQLQQILWLSQGNGLRMHRLLSNDDVEVFAAEFEQPITFLPPGLAANGTYSSSARWTELEWDGGTPTSFTGNLEMTITTQGIERLQTGAGSFECLKVEIAETWTYEGEFLEAAGSTWWLAADVGIVKTLDDDGVVAELASFEIPGGPPATPPPAITSQPRSQTVAPGSRAEFSVDASGGDDFRFQWRKDGLDLPGQTRKTLTIEAAQLTDAGDYSVLVSSTSGTVASQVATLTVQPASPPVSTEVKITAFAKLSGNVFRIEFDARPGEIYTVEISRDLRTWSLLRSLSATSNSGWLEDPQPVDPQRFYRVRRGAAGIQSPVIIRSPQSQTRAPGGEVTLEVHCTGTDLNYQWMKDGLALSGQNGATLRLTNLAIADAGEYSVIVRNAFGQSTSPAARITITQSAGRIGILPEPGVIHEAGAQLGGPLFGVEFTVPAGWKGGLREGLPWLFFGSDTKPGLVLGLLGFGYTRDEILNENELRNGFELDLGDGNRIRFLPVNPLAMAGENRITAGFQGGDAGGQYALLLEIVLHPSGGYMGFLGITAPEQSGVMQAELRNFGVNVRSTPRPTQVEMTSRLHGRSFKWAGKADEWYSGNYSGSASTAKWGDNFAFFCANGTVEINSESTSYIQTSGGGGFFSQSFSATTKEYGEWTIVRDPEFGDLMLLVLPSGYQILPVQLQSDGTLLVKENKLAPHGTFDCN